MLPTEEYIPLPFGGRCGEPIQSLAKAVLEVARDAGAGEWQHPYTREQAAYPAPWVHLHKYWPTVGRIDSAWGDRNLACACPSLEAYL